jgi:hypothetical protein
MSCFGHGRFASRRLMAISSGSTQASRIRSSQQRSRRTELRSGRLRLSIRGCAFPLVYRRRTQSSGTLSQTCRVPAELSSFHMSEPSSMLQFAIFSECRRSVQPMLVRSGSPSLPQRARPKPSWKMALRLPVRERGQMRWRSGQRLRRQLKLRAQRPQWAVLSSRITFQPTKGCTSRSSTRYQDSGRKSSNTSWPTLAAYAGSQLGAYTLICRSITNMCLTFVKITGLRASGRLWILVHLFRRSFHRTKLNSRRFSDPNPRKIEATLLSCLCTSCVCETDTLE